MASTWEPCVGTVRKHTCALMWYLNPACFLQKKKRFCSVEVRVWLINWLLQDQLTITIISGLMKSGSQSSGGHSGCPLLICQRLKTRFVRTGRMYYQLWPAALLFCDLFPTGCIGPDLRVLRGGDHCAWYVRAARQGAEGRGASPVPGHRGHQRAGHQQGQKRDHQAHQGGTRATGQWAVC